MTLAKRGDGPVGLMRVEQARQMLAECRKVDEAKSIRDKAEAIKAYLRRQKAGRDAALDAEEIALRAEIRCGELLREQKETGQRANGGRPKHSHGATVSAPTLKDLGIGKDASSRWQQIAAVAEKTPEKIETYIREQREAKGAITTSDILKGPVREMKRTAKHDAIAEQAKSAAPIDAVQPCPVVYADPPWQYGNTAGASAAEDEYPTMPLADICALKVPATRDAVLFLWATSPLLPEAMQVINAWGFTYKGSMVWDKDRGTGNWVLNCHELLLIAVRGDMPCPAPSNRPKSVISAPIGKHSAKPEAFAEAIERMFPGLPKVEMFARKAREGWSVWGNQAA